MAPALDQHHERIMSTIERVLAATADYPRMRRNPGIELYVWALFARTRAMTRALVLLSNEGLLFLGAGLVRQIFEHAALGLWLREDPERFHLLSGDFERRLRVLAEEHPGEFGDEYDSLVRTFGAREAKESLPPLEQRLVSPMDSHYGWYRQLAMYDHAGFRTMMQMVDQNRRGRFVVLDEPVDLGREQRWIAYAALTLCFFAHELYHGQDEAKCKALVDASAESLTELFRWGPSAN